MDEADTQELTQRMHEDPQNDQIGYLLVEGFIEHPIKKGVTVIGRDPQKCDIILEDESVSKMHAVIRIKTATEFFLIDMTSKNGTKCKGIPLKPKCPTRFHYDDKIEFGSVFVLLRRSEGRPLDHENSLPETQAMETPVRGRSAGSPHKQLTIPESPEGSDKEDSFLAPSRPQPRKKSKDKSHRNSNMINKDSSNESLFWKATTQSPSFKFDLDDSTSSINDSVDPNVSKGKECDIPKMSINEMDTQIPDIEAGTQQVTGIHMLETQLPYSSPVVDKIHNMNTQLPEEYNQPPNLLREVQKVEETKEMQINLYSTGKDEESNNNKDQSIYEAATQILSNLEEPNESMNVFSNVRRPEKRGEVHVSESDEEIMCEEFESDDFEVPNSQALNDVIEVPSTVSPVAQTKMKDSVATDINNTADANIETASLANPKSSKKPCDNFVNDDDSTDCEEEDITIPNDKENVTNLMVSSMNITETCSKYNVMGALPNVEEDISDLPTQVLPSIAEDICDAPTQVVGLPIEDIMKAPTQKLLNANQEANVSDLPTQIICEPREDICEALTQVVGLPVEDINNAATQKLSNVNEEANVSDLATQIICEPREGICEASTPVIGPPIKVKNNAATRKSSSNTKSEADVSDFPTQVIVSEIINDADEKLSPGKPKEVKSPFKIPSNTAFIGKANRLPRNTKSPTVRSLIKSPVRVAEEKNYYAATQDIVEDLLSQKDPASVNHYDCTQDVYNDLLTQNDEVVPSSQEDDAVGERFKGLEKSFSPLALTRTSSTSSGTDESEVTKYVSGLSTQQIRDLVGATHKVDMSDMEDTPRKEFDFDELPLSEDISERKTTTRIGTTDAHTTSDEEGNSSAENSESDSPVVFRKKKRAKKVKVNLTSRLDPENLPTRISKRIRKPTEKVKDILVRKESEENIEAEIIQENIAKLKGDKNTLNVAKQTVSSNTLKSEPIKTRKTHVALENKSDNPKIIENPKKSEKSKERVDMQTKPKVAKNFENPNESEQSKEKVDTQTKPKIASNKSNIVVANSENKEQVNKNKVIPDRTEDRPKNKVDLLKEDLASTDSDDEKQPPVKRSRLRAKPNVPKSERQNHKNKSADGKKKSVIKLDSSSDSDKNVEILPVKRHIINRKNEKGSETDSQNEKNRSRNKKDTATNRIKPSFVTVKRVSIYSDSDENAKILPVKRSTRGKAVTDLKNEPKVKTESLEGTKPSIQTVRRSNRQRNSDSVDSATNTPKEKNERTERESNSKDSITPRYDQSRVYSMIEKSDVSILDARVSSPQPTRASRRKMTDTEELVAHTPPKRPRTIANTTPTQRVLFTAYDDHEKRNLLKKLGAEFVEDPNDCTVVVTKQVKRTIKFLCAVSLGRPIVGDQWVLACNKAKKFVDPWSHLLEDTASEKKFKFSLRRSLQAPRCFLAGYNITSTPKALPPPHELKVLVECSGGKWKEGGQKWAVLSTKEDRALWPALRKRGATVVSNEFVLSGVLQQTVDLKTFQISF